MNPRNSPPTTNKKKVDDAKRTEEVKLRLTERELLDLTRIASAEDRSLAAMAHAIVRGFLYGRVSAAAAEAEGPGRD